MKIIQNLYRIGTGKNGAVSMILTSREKALTTTRYDPKPNEFYSMTSFISGPDY